MMFVAFSSPKKEYWVHKYIDQIGIPFVMGVGGSFDVVAGVTDRAPTWMQEHGLEWFYRFIQEPGRLWKRYIIGNGILNLDKIGFSSYMESDMFKPDSGRSAMIYFVADTTLEKSYFDYGRFCFFLQKSVQPVIEEALTNKALQLSVQFLVEGNRPFKDQTEAVFQLKPRSDAQAVR